MPKALKRFSIRGGAGLWLALSWACSRSSTLAVPESSAAAVAAVSGYGMSVLDLDSERRFFGELGFRSRAETVKAGPAFAALVGMPAAEAREQVLELGQQELRLTQFVEPRGRDVRVQSARDLGFQHLAIVVRRMTDAYAKLAQTPFSKVSVEPQTLPSSNPVAGGVRATYFRDPEGHFLELVEFPPGKGDAVWQKPSASMFLGIDHTAIACADTERSLHFYRDGLGMTVKSQSLNEGVEQERLSGVPGARVQVTSLRGRSGPGIELLRYIEPAGGAAFPIATAADSVHWEITVAVSSVAQTLARLEALGFATTPAPHTDTSTVVLVKDPDGHTLRLAELAGRDGVSRP